MIRNITLSADEAVIERARAHSRRRKTSLNAAFRQWLEQYGVQANADSFAALMERLDVVQAGRSFSRDELNER